MEEAWNYEQCVSVLTSEIELLRIMAAAQDCVRQAVVNREWADFDEKTLEVNRAGEQFAILEEERDLLFSALSGESGNREEKPFYAIISVLPPEEARELARLYRELKTESLKMQARNETFLAYLNEAKTMAAAYLEAVYPNRGGKLYSRMGRRVSQDLRSMVFNTQF